MSEDITKLLNCLPMNTIRQIEGDLMFNVLNVTETKGCKQASEECLKVVSPIIPRHNKLNS